MDTSKPIEIESEQALRDDLNAWGPEMEHVLDILGRLIHRINAQWWLDLNTGARLTRNVGELLMLVVSEVAEGMEGHRKSLQDDKLPNRPMLEVELADAIIRILDIGCGFNLDIAGALIEKLRYNIKRPDHKAAARLAPNGKKY